jgi:Uma2 family endonuclease
MEAMIDQDVSAYERERNKPIPTLLHGAIQFNIGFELKIAYPNRFRIASEVLLDTKPVGSTPDVVLYPLTELDFKHDPSRRSDAPLLVVEIQSASQSTKEMVDKLDTYFDFGVSSCWIVLPDIRAILVYDSPSHYEFFHDDVVLTDQKLAVELSLKNIFS